MSNINISERQQKILELLAGGYLQEDIANELGVTQDSIAYHIRILKERLNAKTLAHIVAKGFRKRLIQ